MAIMDISWGNVIKGAAIAVAIAAIAPVTLVGGTALAGAAVPTIIQAMAASMGGSTLGAVSAVGLAGGVVGEFVGDLIGRAKDAGAAITR